MKLLLINTDKGWGGGQEHLIVLAHQLTQQGHEVHLLCREGSRSATAFSALGYTVHPTPRSKGAGFAVRLLSAIAGTLRRERFAAVLISREHDLLPAVLAWRWSLPGPERARLVMCYHIATARRQWLLDQADAVVCISTHVRQALQQGNPGLQVTVQVLHNGIPLPGPVAEGKFAVGRPRRFFHGETGPLIGMVGAFFKNQLELVEALPPLLASFPALKLALIGDPSDAGLVEPLRQRIAGLGVEQAVIFTGWVNPERLPDLYFDLDLAVSTFRNEGFGLVFLESMAAGTPVVSYNAGGVRDILAEGVGGVMVDGGPQEFAAAVAGLLADDRQRFKAGRAAVQLVRDRFSAEAMGQRYGDFLAGLCREQA